MTPHVASMRITRSIRSVEEGMDELLAKAGELMAELARARLATVAVAGDGHRPLSRIAAMQKSLMDARLEVVRAHGDLARLAETMDIAVECPKTAQAMPAEQPVAAMA